MILIFIFCYILFITASADFFYSLRDVLFYLENAEIPMADYRRKVVTARITAIVETDKSNLKSYLTGQIDSCPQLDFAAASAAYNVTTSYNAVAQEEVVVPVVSLLSAQLMQEQRQRHAALIDQSILIPTQTTGAEVAGLSHDKLEELRLLRRTQKRKSVVTDGGFEGIDATFIQVRMPLCQYANRNDDIYMYIY